MGTEAVGSSRLEDVTQIISISQGTLPSAQRHHHRVRPISGLELIHDIFDVKINGGLREIQSSPAICLFLFPSLINFENFKLAGREILLPHVLCDKAGVVGRDVPAPSGRQRG